MALEHGRSFMKGKVKLSSGDKASPARCTLKLPTEIEVASDFRPQPTANLGSKILTQMAVAEKVARSSKNLKGTTASPESGKRPMAEARRTPSAREAKTKNTTSSSQDKQLTHRAQCRGGRYRNRIDGVDPLTRYKG